MIKRFFDSFYYAGRGLGHAFKTELNFRIEIFISILVISALIYFHPPVSQTIVVLLLIMAVLVMELMNTAFEYMTDLLKPRLNHYVAAIKEVLAAAVLITSLVSATIGILIFWPYFMTFLK